MLQAGLLESARDVPAAVALIETDGTTVSFGTLASLGRHVAATLGAMGFEPGDRVAVHLPKSVDAVAAICGTLMAGGTYVPIDRTVPADRAATMVADCGAAHLITTGPAGGLLKQELSGTGVRTHNLPVVGSGRGLAPWGATPTAGFDTAAACRDEEAAACILYTSGSTGRPKGVVLSHRAVSAFVDWATDSFRPGPTDRLASHAPFQFDLSLFDLFVAQRAGAAVVLIDDATSRSPRRLADLIASLGVTISYSTPTTLQLLLDYGDLEGRAFPRMRLVLFAGEVFPLPHLRRLIAMWPSARFFNLFGPTETNVCTWYEVPSILPADPGFALPIGWPCSHSRVRIVDGGRPVAAGEKGELLVAGTGVMTGYWNLPDADAVAFHSDPDGTRWYRTGDVVSRSADGLLRFHGRRDRMVKRRGYRIELAEIEATLAVHPDLQSVAVAAQPDDRRGVTIHAYVTCSTGNLSVIELKRFCAERLPPHMVPDRFMVLEHLPVTTTGKIDYRALPAGLANSGG